MSDGFDQELVEWVRRKCESCPFQRKRECIPSCAFFELNQQFNGRQDHDQIGKE